jgi:putative tricarboxylic transport membrane protein
MMGSRGELGVFWSNWLIGTITTLAPFMLFWPMLAFAWRKFRQLSGGNPDIDVKFMEK